MLNVPVPQVVVVQGIARVVHKENEVKVKKTVGLQVELGGTDAL